MQRCLPHCLFSKLRSGAACIYSNLLNPFCTGSEFADNLKTVQKSKISRNSVSSNDASQNERKNFEPAFAAHYRTDTMRTLKTADDILNVLNSMSSNRKIIIIEAIFCLGRMHEYKLGFQIFEQAKTDRHVTQDTYAAIMWLLLEQNRNKKTIERCLKLLEEMETKFQLKPSKDCHCYQILLTNCTYLGLIDYGTRLIDKIEKEDKGIIGKNVASDIVNFYAKMGEISKALRFIQETKQQFGKKMLQHSDYMFSSILSGIADVIATENDDEIREENMEIAQRVFATSCKLNDKPPGLLVFSSLITVYATFGDIDSCWDVLEAMQNQDDYPNANIMVITAFVKGLKKCNDHKITENQVWEIVDKLTVYIEDNKIKPNIVFYTNLFRLCGRYCKGKDGLNKLKGYYLEMVKKNKLVPTEYTMVDFMINGVHIVENDQSLVDDKELQKFLKWGMEGFGKYNLSMSRPIRHQLWRKVQWLTIVNKDKEGLFKSIIWGPGSQKHKTLK